MLFEIYIFKKHEHWETYFNMEQSFLIPTLKTFYRAQAREKT